MERIKISSEEYGQALAESENRGRPTWSLASIRYDRRRNRIIMGLEKGVEFSLPLAMIGELSGVPPDVLAQMYLTPSGEVLAVDEIDAHIGTKGLIEAALSVLPARAFAATLGAAGGTRSTSAKRNAAAENGKKGGRPPKGRSERGSADA
jgi:hypothetical protein